MGLLQGKTAIVTGAARGIGKAIALKFASEGANIAFTDLALNFRNLIHYISRELPDDVVVYFLHHTELDAAGKVKAKTIGRMLDEKLTVEGCFDIVLLAQVEGGEHFFTTQSDGYTSAKSPEGMFEQKIPNDLAAVDAAIREYWGL